MTATRDDVEEVVLGELADLGLVVPPRDPSRPHTNNELRCWKVGVTGLPSKGGKAWKGRHPCKGPGCESCADSWADGKMSGLRRTYGDFVPLDPVYRTALSTYRAKRDKLAEPCLWVTSVATPPDTSKAVKVRMKTRAKRLSEDVTWVAIPCDAMTVVVATADLAQAQERGRHLDPPTSGIWLPAPVALLYVQAVLASTAVCGRLDWPDPWAPVEPVKQKNYTISGPPLITDTAWRILTSEGYTFEPGGSKWIGDDPDDVLQTAKRRAIAFWADPTCEACGTIIAPDDKYWWQEGHPLCSVCDLAFDLLDVMTTGRTEREIDSRLHFRKLTFRRNRTFIELGLDRMGASRAPSGIWVPRAAGEKAA